MADAEGEGEPQAAASTDEEKASATIVAAAKGRQQRKENAERQAAAAKIGAHAKGRRVRSKKKGGDGGDGGGAGDAAAGPADAGGGGGGDEEAAAAQKISAVAKGRHQRRVDAERRAAAAKIEAVAKGRRARKEYNDEAKKRAKETAHKPAPAPPAAGASPDTYDEPDVPAAPGVVDRGAELPMTFARPPVMYKFVGLDKSKTRKNARSYSQTYSINVEGYHRAQQTKLIITIEVQGALQGLEHVEPLNPNLTPEDLGEIAYALVNANVTKMTIADYGALFLLSQFVFSKVLPAQAE